MNNTEKSKFIKGLQQALQKEQASQRIYLALAEQESNEALQKAFIGLVETEKRQGERWATRLKELGVELPSGQESLRERIWRWVLVQSGTDNALKRIESAEDDDTEMYEALAQLAPTEADQVAVRSVLHDEEVHSGSHRAPLTWSSEKHYPTPAYLSATFKVALVS